MTNDRTNYEPYAIRYSFEDWNKPVPPEDYGDQTIGPEIPIRPSKSNYGYTDEFLMASIVDGTVMLGSSDGGLIPSRRILTMVRDVIDHYLKYHSSED